MTTRATVDAVWAEVDYRYEQRRGAVGAGRWKAGRRREGCAARPGVVVRRGQFRPTPPPAA